MKAGSCPETLRQVDGRDFQLVPETDSTETAPAPQQIGLPLQTAPQSMTQ